MSYAIKVAITDPKAARWSFTGQKTMYGGKEISVGDAIFVFASENEGGVGLIAKGIVTEASAVPRRRGVARQTPRVNVSIRRVATARRRLGRDELKSFVRWKDGGPESELNFKFYRQATYKIVGISDGVGRFLDRFFRAR